MSDDNASKPNDPIPVIDLSLAPGARETWDKPRVVIYLWAFAELLFVSNPWQPSSKLRVLVLRAFGARIGKGVIFRPRTRVKFPWKLHVGRRAWIGEGVWIHNQDHVSIGSDTVISQEVFITTGSHSYRSNMALVTRPVAIEDGVWLTTRCMVTGGVTIGRSSMVRPMNRITNSVPPNVVWDNGSVVGARF